MAKILSVASHKGGVGKSTSSLLIAMHFVSKGWRVLLIDNDPQGNSSSTLLLDAHGESAPLGATHTVDLYDPDLAEIEVTKTPLGIDLIPVERNCERMRAVVYEADIDELVMRNNTRDLVEDYDLVIIDCAPSFSQSTTAALAMSTHVITPVKLRSYAVDGAEGILMTISQVRGLFNEQLQFVGVFVNMMKSDSKSRRYLEELEELREALGDLLLTNVIHERKAIDTAVSEGRPLRSLGYAHQQAKEVERIMNEIEERIR